MKNDEGRVVENGNTPGAGRAGRREDLVFGLVVVVVGFVREPFIEFVLASGVGFL